MYKSPPRMAQGGCHQSIMVHLMRKHTVVVVVAEGRLPWPVLLPLT